MAEVLTRIDATGVAPNVFKLLYTVPAGKTFVVSGINTTSANVVKIRIDNKEIGQYRPKSTILDFFRGLVLLENESIYVTHGLSGTNETIMMSGSLIDN